MTRSAGAVRSDPPVTANVRAVACIDTTSAPMLNSVWYQGVGVFRLNVHCAHPPASIVHVVAAGPSTSSEKKLTAEPIESVDEDASPEIVSLIVFSNTDAAMNDSSSSGRLNAPSGIEAIASADRKS